MIDEASSQPALWRSRQIQRPSANFPPRNRIISPICSGAMCYHLLQRLQIPDRLVHEADQTLLMLLVLCYQLDNIYRCISSKSLGRDHAGHMKLWSSLQGHRRPTKGINLNTQKSIRTLGNYLPLLLAPHQKLDKEAFHEPGWMETIKHKMIAIKEPLQHHQQGLLGQMHNGPMD